MMEVHRPTSTRYIALIGTSANPKERPPVALCWSTGRLTSEPVDEKMARNTKSKPNAEVKVSIALLEIFAPNEAPARRPISMRNQYVPTTKPEMVEEMPAPPFSIGSVKNKFRVPGTPTSTPTYTKIAIAPKMKWRNFKAPDINLPIGSVEVAALGSGMGTIRRTKNAMANTAIAVYITGNI